jgi:hypothetical protein
MSFIDELKKQIQDINTSTREIKKLGLAFFIILGIIGSLFWWKERPHWFYFWGAGLLLGFLGLVWPKGLRPLYRVWMSLIIIINFIIVRVILILLYYLVLTPTGLILKVLGRDILDLRLKDRPSYWNQRDQTEPSHAELSDSVVFRQGSRKILLMVKLWMFLWNRKKFLLLPIILVLILLGFLILLGEGSIAPFIYTLF